MGIARAAFRGSSCARSSAASSVFCGEFLPSGFLSSEFFGSALFSYGFRLPLSCVLCLLLFAGSVSGWGQSDATSPGARTNLGDQVVVPPADSNTGFLNIPPGSESADKEAKVRFRSQTIMVQVPAVVTDAAGNHIHGLTKDDFHLFENGMEQKIAQFEEVVTTNKQIAVAAARPGVFANLTVSDEQPRAVAILALDAINTPFLEQATAREELAKFLSENLNSGQLFALMIITGHGVKIVQGLTDDREKLVQVLKKAGGELPELVGLGPDTQAMAAAGDIPEIPTSTGGLGMPGARKVMEHNDAITTQVAQQRAIEGTLTGMLEIAWALEGVPGRKSLIWATGGFPFAIASADQLPGGYLSPLYERTMESLEAAQISVYPVDVRGLVVTDGSAAAASTTTQKFGTRAADRVALQQSMIETFNEFADMTGGKAFYNTNDLASSFRRAADDASSYYVATYYLDTHNRNPGWRVLKVKVDKKGAEVRARTGFFVTNTTMDPEATRRSDLLYALSSPIEGTGVPLSVKWVGMSGSGEKKKVEFMLHLPPGSVAIEGGGGENRLNFEMAAAAYVVGEKSGKSPLTTGKTVAMPVPAAQMASLRTNGIDMKNTLELGPGQYVVRVVIRDNITGRVGSVTAPLTVN